jgi:hypothetical protein
MIVSWLTEAQPQISKLKDYSTKLKNLKKKAVRFNM